MDIHKDANPQTTDKEPVDLIKHALNSHGFPFQQAVINEVHRLHERGGSPWTVVEDEIPVSQGRIDILLKYRNKPLYLIAECKRPDPALSTWCFAQSLHCQQAATPSITLESFFLCDQWLTSDPKAVTVPGVSAFDISWVVRDPHSKGDGSDGRQGREAIEKSAGQLMRGTKGFIEYFSSHPLLLPSNIRLRDERPTILPVLFTTAKLWRTIDALANASVTNGNIDSLSPRETSCIYYNHRSSLELQALTDCFRQYNDIVDVVRNSLTRTIAIVGSANSGIESFLTANVFEWFA